MTADGLVSVVIPTHYRNDGLRRAIESALSQTYEPVEVIVVDDSGEGHAEPVAREYDVTYLAHEKNRGGNPARNTGIEAASGEHVQLLDDDDQILPEKLERQVPLLESDASVGVMYCGLREVSGEPTLPNPENRGDVLEQALRFDLHPCQTVTMLFDGELLGELHPLATREAADDIGLKIRAAARTRFEFVDEVLVVRGSSESHRAAKLEYSDEILNMVEEFDHLYDRFDESVRRDALVFGYESRGYRLLGRHWWSSGAIVAFAKALYY
ncbi:MAG: glycosyltransferase family 2 protein, partial [Haloarculaceae archaeon]